jgi:hypothetical protein
MVAPAAMAQVMTPDNHERPADHGLVPWHRAGFLINSID